MTKSGFYRIWDICGDKTKGITGIIPVSKSGFYNGIKAGIFPAPVRVGRVNMWPISAIEKLVAELEGRPI